MLTTKQVAERLGLRSHRSVINLIKRGQLRAEKVGRDWLITEEAVEEYRQARRPAHRPKKPTDDSSGTAGLLP